MVWWIWGKSWEKKKKKSRGNDLLTEKGWEQRIGSARDQREGGTHHLGPRATQGSGATSPTQEQEGGKENHKAIKKKRLQSVQI